MYTIIYFRAPLIGELRDAPSNRKEQRIRALNV
jgi:hypothetical protein